MYTCVIHWKSPPRSNVDVSYLSVLWIFIICTVRYTQPHSPSHTSAVNQPKDFPCNRRESYSVVMLKPFIQIKTVVNDLKLLMTRCNEVRVLPTPPPPPPAPFSSSPGNSVTFCCFRSIIFLHQLKFSFQMSSLPNCVMSCSFDERLTHSNGQWCYGVKIWDPEEGSSGRAKCFS